MLEKLKGKVSFGRVHGSSDEFRIEVTDDNSLMRVIEIRILPKDFPDFMSNRFTECTFDFNDSSDVGKKRITKEVEIEFPKLPYSEVDARPIVEPILAKYEIDGWKADRYCVYQSRHKASPQPNGNMLYTVYFHKFI